MDATEHVEQPMPVPNDQPSIQSLVRTDLEQREQIGISRYGTPLQPFNGRDGLRDAYEEVLDLATYLRQIIEERDQRTRPTDNEPDHLRDYRDFWAPIVENADGTLNRDKVARELADYHLVMREVSKAYDELTGGRLSKPNSAAHHVIAFANEVSATDHAADILDALYEQMTSDEDRAALVEYANGQHPEAWDAYQRAVANRNRLAAEQSGEPS